MSRAGSAAVKTKKLKLCIRCNVVQLDKPITKKAFRVAWKYVTCKKCS
jgi:hypothetical protein